VQSSLWNSWLVQQKISIVKYEKFDQIENTQAVVNLSLFLGGISLYHQTHFAFS
jgi:hypothetical protein